MKKGLIIFHHNMEDSESLSTRALLVRSGINMVSVAEEKRVITAFGQVVEADISPELVVSSEYDFLVIPGGKYVSEIIDTNQWINNIINQFYHQKKLIAAICAAPRFLGKLGLLNNVEFTAFPGSEEDALLGLYLPQKKVVMTPDFITARGAGCVIEFSSAIIERVLGKTRANKILKDIQYE